MAKTSVGRLQNLSVSVQRRWNNVLSDATRQVLSYRFVAPSASYQSQLKTDSCCAYDLH